MTIAWPIGYLFGLESAQVSRIVQVLVPLICIWGVIVRPKLPIRKFPKIILLYLIVSLVYVLVAEPDKPKALFHYVGYAAIIWVCFCYFNRTRDDSFIVKTTFWAILLTGLLTVVAEYIKPSFNPWAGRLAMSWANPVWLSYLGGFSIISVIVLGLFGSKSEDAAVAGKREEIIFSNVIKIISCLFIVGGGLFIMYRGTSVGAVLFLVVTLAIFLLQKGKSGFKYGVLLIIVSFVLFYGGYITDVIYAYKYRIFAQQNYETRWNTYYMTAEFLKENLWFGMGWTDNRFLNLRETYNYRSEAGWAVMLLELGVIRLAIFVLFILLIAFRFLKVYRHSDNLHKLVAAVCIGSLLMNAHEAVYPSLGSPFVFIFMVLWAQLDFYSMQLAKSKKAALQVAYN